jgi:hypothetical protein
MNSYFLYSYLSQQIINYKIETINTQIKDHLFQLLNFTYTIVIVQIRRIRIDSLDIRQLKYQNHTHSMLG